MYYDPGVQLEEIFDSRTHHTVSFHCRIDGHPFWLHIRSWRLLDSQMCSANPLIEHYMYFGWMSYDRSGKVLPPGHSLMGSGFTSGDEHIEHIRFLDELEIETAD